MLRSIGSIATGFAVWTVLFLGTNALLSLVAPGAFKPDGSTDSTLLLLLIVTLSVLFSVVAGWITFKVDRVRALGSSLILGVLLLAVGIFVQLQYWEVMPLWYHLSFLGALIPGVLVGYRLAVTRSPTMQRPDKG